MIAWVVIDMSFISSSLLVEIGSTEPMERLYDFERLYAASVHLTHEGLPLISCERVFFCESEEMGVSIYGITENDGLPRGFWVSEGLEHKFPGLVACGVMQQQFILRLRDVSRQFRIDVPLSAEPYGGDHPFELLVTTAYINQRGAGALAHLPVIYKSKVWVAPGLCMPMYH